MALLQGLVPLPLPCQLVSELHGRPGRRRTRSAPVVGIYGRLNRRGVIANLGLLLAQPEP